MVPRLGRRNGGDGSGLWRLRDSAIAPGVSHLESRIIQDAHFRREETSPQSRVKAEGVKTKGERENFGRR